MSLDLEDDDREALGYGDLYWKQMPLVRSTTTSRRKGAAKVRAPKLRCRDTFVLIAVVCTERDRLAVERKKRDRARTMAWSKKKYTTDPEYRARRQAESRAYNKKAETLKRRRDRYFFDAEYRMRTIAKVRKYQAKKDAR